ncbi:MAG: thiamine phosphate synthase [candidate division WOR-3 bacterium]|nr:thiamine phosphate synthase [candidate division WOR-3 bacterium]
MEWEQILDVNLNRLTEALKLIEDYIRFELKKPAILEKVRNLRYNFFLLKKSISTIDIVSSRQSASDLGRKPDFDSVPREKELDIIMANFTRAKESARIIEEILRMKDRSASRVMKRIRFGIYDLEKIVLEMKEKKFNPRLYAIIDEKYLGKMPLDKMVKTLQDNGATMIQLRIKSLPDKTFYRYAEKIKRLLTNPEIKFIINNRIDIAIGVDADGVHLGQNDIPLVKARKIAGEKFIIGISAHNLNEAQRAQKNGADYLGVGAVYPTQTKLDARCCGLNLIRQLRKKIFLPIIGIGGINDKNYKEVLRAGADGVAVASYLFEGNLKKNLRALKLKDAF